ncbi:hypothetical protein AB8Z38_29415 [Bradyrhizobium sp. LLZ17]|uniref:Uncharacterized protein n=1 Tax=Bradyrhizobium sp. LLZ17 TaxID=3239388 RepID=A0AB39XHL7_9BRAD
MDAFSVNESGIESNEAPDAGKDRDETQTTQLSLSFFASFEAHLVLGVAGRPGAVLHARLLLLRAYLAGRLSLRRSAQRNEARQYRQRKDHISHSIFVF